MPGGVVKDARMRDFSAPLGMTCGGDYGRDGGEIGR